MEEIHLASLEKERSQNSFSFRGKRGDTCVVQSQEGAKRLRLSAFVEVFLCYDPCPKPLETPRRTQSITLRKEEESSALAKEKVGNQAAAHDLREQETQAPNLFRRSLLLLEGLPLELTDKIWAPFLSPATGVNILGSVPIGPCWFLLVSLA